MSLRRKAALSPAPGPDRREAADGPAGRAPTRVGLANPVVVILLLAGLFDGLSGNPVGSLLLVAVGIGLARTREVPEGDAAAAGAGARRRLRGMAAGGVAFGVAGYAALAGAPARFSWPATLAVAVPGAFVVAAAGRYRGSRRPVPAARPMGAAAWAAVLIGLALWELVNLLLQPSFTAGSYAHPTLSVLADPVLASHAGRSAGLAVWLGAGWYLVER